MNEPPPVRLDDLRAALTYSEALAWHVLALATQTPVREGRLIAVPRADGPPYVFQHLVLTDGAEVLSITPWSVN